MIFAVIVIVASFTFSATVAIGQCAEWVPGIGTPGTNERVYALAVLPDGDVIVGGGFTSVGGVAANSIARYNSTTGVWSDLGFVSGGYVKAITVLPEGDLLVGGAFQILFPGDTETRNIARYNPSTGVWSALGLDDSSGIVNAFTVFPNGDVVIGGSFASIGGVSASNIARYVPTTGTLSALGTGTDDGQIEALAILPDGDLIVGGSFTTAGGIPANNVARYNPTSGSWYALGLGTNSLVRAIEVLPGGDLLVGGGFSTAGGVSAFKIARYNPTTGVWSALGSGTGDVFAFTLLPGGDVLVAGVMTSASGVPVNRIARYEPSTGHWSALGSGIEANGFLAYILALANLPDGRVLAGGLFTTAGGMPANNLATCEVGAVPPVILEQPASQTNCVSNTAIFSVSAGGSPPFVYQWQKDSVAINSTLNPSAATATLALTNLQLSDTGSYDCIVTNSCDSASSTGGSLLVEHACCDAKWTTFGTGVGESVYPPPSVSAVAVLPNGHIVVGGIFASAGNVAADFVAQYNPSTGIWSPLGSGTNNYVYSLAVLPDGDLVVGGYFSAVGGQPAYSVARYSPATDSWSSLGFPYFSNGNVRALAVLPNGDIVAGLSYSVVGIGLGKVLRYNAASGTWTELGSGADGRVYAVAVLANGDVIAGGRFYSIDGVAARGIARFNTATGVWSGLGSGVAWFTEHEVNSITVLSSQSVVVGGLFNNAGGVAASHVAIFDTATEVWSAMGSGTNGNVFDVVELPDGELILGGQFNTAGEAAANFIARYAPATGTWSNLGSGANSSVSSLALHPTGDVIVGGWFTMAGDESANYIARYFPGTPAPSILVQPLSQSTLPTGAATFLVTASGTGPTAYQWRKNGSGLTDSSRVSGATTPTLSISPVQSSDQGIYDCIVTDDCFSTTSDGADLSCKAAFSSHPVGGTFATGSQIVLSGSTLPAGSVTYRWRKDGVNLFNAGAFAGVTTPTLTINTTDPSQTGSYALSVTNACGIAVSNAALVEVFCGADLDDGSGTGNPDGGIDIVDLLYFLGVFEAGSPAADLDNGSGNGTPDGGIDINDLLYFLMHFEAGC